MTTTASVGVAPRLACGLWLAGCACASFSTLKTPRAIDPGTFQGSISAGAVTVAPGQFLPQLELAGRWGVVNGFDLGGKLDLLGAEINSTISLVRSRVFDLALAPSAGVLVGGIPFSYCPEEGCPPTNPVVLYAKLPLLAGIPVGHGHEIVFGAEAIPFYLLQDSLARLLVGGMAGFSLSLGSARLMPEVALLVPAAGSFGEYGPLGAAYGSVWIQAALGFSFGNDGYRSH